MSYLELLRALSNGVSAKGMVLAIYRSFSFAYLLFASLKMSGLSIIHSGYCHPPSPDIIPLQTYTQNLHSVPSYPTKGLPTMKLQRCQKHMSKREWGLFSKKCWKWETKSPTLPNSCKTRSSNKKTKFPFQVWVHLLPFPLDISPSIRSEFG